MKTSPRRELENLSDTLIARLVPKIDGLATNPRPSRCYVEFEIQLKS